MLPKAQLKELAIARLEDAKALSAAGRLDGAAYLCGYVIELALKHRVCDVLNWEEFPVTGSEFKGLTSLKTHDLDVLLKFSGCEAKLKAELLAEWSEVIGWTPENRYVQLGTMTQDRLSAMLDAAAKLLEWLCEK